MGRKSFENYNNFEMDENIAILKNHIILIFLKLRYIYEVQFLLKINEWFSQIQILFYKTCSTYQKHTKKKLNHKSKTDHDVYIFYNPVTYKPSSIVIPVM